MSQFLEIVLSPSLSLFLYLLLTLFKRVGMAKAAEAKKRSLAVALNGLCCLIPPVLRQDLRLSGWQVATSSR